MLTFSVIGPGLVLMLTALLVKEKQTRARILLGGMALIIVVRLLSGKWFFLIYWVIMMVIVFAPHLLHVRSTAGKINPRFEEPK